MKRTNIGGLGVWSAGGEDREGGGDGPAIVLCHGFGAPGDDLVPLWREIDAGRGVRWFFPEAPLTLDLGFGGAGRAWWHIDMIRLEEAIRTGRRDEIALDVPDGMPEARTALEACIAELEKSHGLQRSKTLIGGFSQGAMITTEIALHSADRPWAGLVILSGTLLCRDRWKKAAETAGPAIAAVQTHGRKDPLLPFYLAEELRDILRASGAQIEFVTHGGGHELPGTALDAFGRFARDRLGRSAA
jgi:phospholipase/carboxylesterase